MPVAQAMPTISSCLQLLKPDQPTSCSRIASAVCKRHLFEAIHDPNISSIKQPSTALQWFAARIPRKILSLENLFL